MAVDKEQVKQALQETFIIDEVVTQMAKEDNLEPDPNMIKSNRGRMWGIFADEVANHIENYTIKQYKDYPEDQVTGWDEHILKEQIQKYLNRLDSNQRGDMEANMDLIKIAHYAQMIGPSVLDLKKLFLKLLLSVMLRKRRLKRMDEKTKVVYKTDINIAVSCPDMGTACDMMKAVSAAATEAVQKFNRCARVYDEEYNSITIRHSVSAENTTDKSGE